MSHLAHESIKSLWCGVMSLTWLWSLSSLYVDMSHLALESIKSLCWYVSPGSGVCQVSMLISHVSMVLCLTWLCSLSSLYVDMSHLALESIKSLWCYVSPGSAVYQVSMLICLTWLLSLSSLCCFSCSNLSFSLRCWSRVPRTVSKSCHFTQRATSLFGLVFCSVQNSDWAKVKAKSEVDFFFDFGLSERLS